MSIPWSWTHEQKIPSRTDAAGRVVDALLEQLRRDEWEPHDVFGVHMAVEEALTLSRQAGDRRHEATSLRRLAIMLSEQRRFADMLPLARQALDLHRQLGDRSEEAHDLNVIGIALTGLGQFAEAEAYIRESGAVAEAVELRVAVSNAIANLVDLRLRLRDPQGALAVLDEYAAHPALADDEAASATLRWQRANVLADLGQFEAALKLASEVRPRAEALFGGSAALELGAFIARCQAELGELDAAQAGLEALLATQFAEAVPYGRGAVLYELSFVQRLQSEAAGGDRARLEAARRSSDEVMALARQFNPVRALAYALDYAAEVSLALGEHAAALALSMEAVQTADDHPHEHFILERFLYTRARVRLALGRASEAADDLRRAQALVMAVAERLTDDALRRGWLENVRANRGLLALARTCTAGEKETA